MRADTGINTPAHMPTIPGALATPADYFALLKPRVMSLVVFTALVGMVLAPGQLHPFIAAVSILCIAIGAGASGALNQWYDADIDGHMKRTANRPIPSGAVAPHSALAYGLIMSAFSVFTLGLAVNWLSAALLAFTIFFYAVVYSHWLKRSTPQNIVIGGAAGAFPPMIGWAAVTGSISLESVLLFAIIFIWTPPHFWALALFKADEYRKVNIPMMPIVKGNRSTQNQIFAYSLLLLPLGISPWFIGLASTYYGLFSTAMGALFVYFAFKVLQMGSDDVEMKPAKKLFGFSIFYLFSLFAFLLVEASIARIAG